MANPAVESCDVAIAGAGAAGLMAAIWAGRSRPGLRIIALDGASKLGAKILVAGGGRCNVTHDVVTESDYAGAPRSEIRRVLRRFGVADTVAFFQALGVTLKREETGKLFPVSDDARTVLNALLRAARDAGAELRHPARVEEVIRTEQGFRLAGPWGVLACRQLILATGGRALPKSGSDGGGYRLAQALGHTLTPRIFPALVPLQLPGGHPLTAISGLATPVTLTVQLPSGKRAAEMSGALLCTHFGLSGPAAMDISRWWSDARADDPAARLLINWLPARSAESIDEELRQLGKLAPLGWLRRQGLPDRLARTLYELAELPDELSAAQWTREQRRALLQTVTAFPAPVIGDRGWHAAETTAGGVPLHELDLRTMASKRCPGLYLCGEICDVDGRIGGYNFQWAWAGGFVAGTAAAQAAGI